MHVHAHARARARAFVCAFVCVLLVCMCAYVCVRGRVLVCMCQWIKQLVRIFGPELIRINTLNKTARSTVSKNRSERDFFAEVRRDIFENVTLVARQKEHFRGFGAIVWLPNSLQKEVFDYTWIHLLPVNSFVTASSHALWRVLSNRVIWVFGQCWVDTPHISAFQGDSVLI